MKQQITDNSQTFECAMQDPRVKLKAIGRNEKEAYELGFLIAAYIIPSRVRLEPHDENDFGLEAKLVSGPDELDGHEPVLSSYEIEVRPIKGSIKELSFEDRQLEMGCASPDSISFFYIGKEFYKGTHRVTIFYNPSQ